MIGRFIRGFALFVMVLNNVSCKRVILQGLNKRSMTNHEVLDLSNASDGKGVMITPGKPLTINFCIRVKTKVNLYNVRFSNSNESALFRVSLDHGKWMGTYFSPPGDSWNTFKDTGRFPKQHEFESGWHVLKINVSDTSAAIALDYIEFDVYDKHITENILSCETICIPDGEFPFHNELLTSKVTKATILQRSETTECAEVDNVNIAMFHPYITEFSITATSPQYNSFSNRKEPDFTNCPTLSHVLWSFKNFQPKTGMPHLVSKNSSLHIAERQGSKNSINMVVLFHLDGLRSGSIDSRIGSHIFLRFKQLTSPVIVNLRYRGQHGNMSLLEEKLYDSRTLEHMWKVPDFTWKDDTENFMVFSILGDSKGQLDIEEIRMEKRPLTPDRAETLYKSDDVIIEVVYVEFWWLAPESMTVTLTSGEQKKGVAYIRFYRPIPWTGGYAQVLVLYHDGNIRLLPLASEGVDWIPFGTSVIVGQPRMDTNRPYVKLKEVIIDPERWQIGLMYKDGASVRMKLNCTYSQTQLSVTDLYFTKDPFTTPFVTLRSMFVTEGNNDVDSVKIDDKYSTHIMDDFGSLQGRSFAFFRRCISKHNTLSPDIQVDIVRTSFKPSYIPLAHRYFTQQNLRMKERSDLTNMENDIKQWL